MKKVFEPNITEKKWYFFWRKLNFFSKKKLNCFFVILLPPPNITGNLHMGHAFQNSLIDIFLKFNNFLGKNVFLQGGTDHAGIATQIVLERRFLYNKEHFRNFIIGSKIFSNIINWVNFAQKNIIRQIISLGSSLDWCKLRFTLDFDYIFLVNQSFLYLYENNIIYKGLRLVNWDPVLCSAISDLEVVYKEEISKMWFIKYVFADCNEYFLSVATTRPETIFGDVAVAVNPNDERYSKYIGQYVLVPILNRKIPIIADISVDKNFCSGCLKITPAHDFLDFEIAKKHSLPFIKIFNKKLQLNINVPKCFRYLTKDVVRDKVILALRTSNLLIKEEVCKTKVAYGDRTNSHVEPYLTNQWFVRMNSLVKYASCVNDKNTMFIPKKWNFIFFSWLKNARDWCISRQLWWGHRIPIWYDFNHNQYSGYNKKDVTIFFNLNPSVVLKRDVNVLDTWFSSALWPFAFLKKNNNLIEFRKFFSTSLLVTGFDIIFFWVIRMVVFSLRFTKKLPFKIVYIHGLIRDANGKKMSKFKGNILDPLDLIYGVDFNTLLIKRCNNTFDDSLRSKVYQSTHNQFPCGIQPYGVDVLRFYFFSLASENLFIKFDSSKIFCFKLLCNKLWNVARYVFLFTSLLNFSFYKFPHSLDKMILRIWATVKVKINTFFFCYSLSNAAMLLHNFIKIDFCFWYLEFTKLCVFDFTSNHAFIKSRQTFLLFIFEEILRILHPIMPYFTEEVWQKFPIFLKRTNQTILQVAFPSAKITFSSFIDFFDESFNFIKIFISNLRSFRGARNIKSSTIIILSSFKVPTNVCKFLLNYNDIFFSMGNFIVIDNYFFFTGENSLEELETLPLFNFLFFVFLK